MRFVAEVVPDSLTAPLTLYIPRIGNTFVIVVNGRELARFGTLPPNLVDDAATGPRKFVIPAEWLELRTTIDITIDVRGGRMGGLSVLTLGPESAVRGTYALAYVQEVSGRLVLVVATALLGVLGLLLWLRLRDVGYLYYGLAELLWTVATMRPLFEEAPLPWPVWGYVYKAAFMFAVPLQCKFALMVVTRTEQWPARLNHGLLLLPFPILALGMALGSNWLMPLWQGILVLDMCVVAWAIIDTRNRGAEQERKVLAVASVVLVVAAVRDLLALTFSPDLYPTLLCGLSHSLVRTLGCWSLLPGIFPEAFQRPPHHSPWGRRGDAAPPYAYVHRRAKVVAVILGGPFVRPPALRQ